MTAAHKATLNPLAIAILELLLERPMHPYEMRQLMRDRGVVHRVKDNAGALYRTVERLTEQGVLEVVDTHRAGNRPERTVYRVTGAGKDAFDAQALDMLSMPAKEFPQFPIAVAVLHQLEPQSVINALQARLYHLESELAGSTAVTNALTEKELHPLYWMDYQYSATMLRTEYDWVAKLLESLRSGEIKWPAEKMAGDFDD
jgi:DNA-binding PadR family transcriptional regulator